MSIEREGRFLVDHDLKGRLSIGIESGKIAACVAEAHRRKAYGVFGCSFYKFKETDLNFLEDLPQIQAIAFVEINLKNVDGVYALKRLKEFDIHLKRPGVDFTRLPMLETLSLHYNAEDTGLASLKNVKVFYLWHFNPKSATFERVEFPENIEEMDISWANPKSLEGLPKLTSLKSLEIARCRNLRTLKHLPDIAPNLEHLVVDSCGKVADGEAVVRRLPKIRHAYVRDKVILSLPDLPREGVRRADS